MERFYQVKSQLVQWPAAYSPSLRHDGTLDRLAVENAIQSLSSLANTTIYLVEQASALYSLLAPVRLILESVRRDLPSASARGSDYDLTINLRVSGPIRAFRGPQTLSIDPVFEPNYSLMEKAAPTFSDNLHEVIPYFWTLAMREAFASDLCLLNAVEYDGLPIAFYRDMAKQAWDEIRHADFYLRCSIDLFDQVESGCNRDSQLTPVINGFRNNGRGLPVPIERNLSEAFWNASLTERLILMQFRTEAPAVQRLGKKLQSNLCKRFPRIARGLQIDRDDEKSHAQIGSTWLRYLVTDSSQRRAAIYEADELRPVLLLTAFCRQHGQSLSSLVRKYSSGERLPGEAVYTFGSHDVR